MNINNLRRNELVDLLRSYDRYIQDANDEDAFSTGWRPVCIGEYYDNEYQELKEKVYITIGETIVITDPCYRLGIWCQTKLENMKPGRYQCIIKPINEGQFGIRNASITICHEDYNLDDYYPENIVHGTVAVDSGQAGFFDYEYFKATRGEKQIDETDEAERFYDECCRLTNSSDRAGVVDGKGFVSESGFGDGCYTLYSALNEERQIVALELEFITDEE